MRAHLTLAILLAILSLGAAGAEAAVTISPTSATVDMGNCPVGFTATSNGTPFSWLWSASSGTISGGNCSEQSTCSATYFPPHAPGTYTVTVRTSFGDSASANVTVRQPQITILPFDRQVPQRESQTIQASVSGVCTPTIVWSVSGGGSLLNDTGTQTTFVAGTKAGTWTIRATESFSLVSDAESITVLPPVSVTVSPDDAVIQSGALQTYQAQVLNTSDPSVTWSAANGTVVSTTSTSATIRAGTTIGFGSVTARSAADTTKADSASFEVVPVPTVEVSPASLVLLPGSSYRFLVRAIGLSDSRVGWSTSGSGSSVDAAGLFTAGSQLGTFEVRATSVSSPAVFGTASVTISDTLPAPESVSVNPTEAVVAPLDSQRFVFFAQGQNHDPHPNQDATWNVLEPSGAPQVVIGADGVFTAPDFRGTYKVIATSAADSAQSASADVTVPALVEISPPTATVAPGGKVAFSGTAFGVGDPAVTWAIQESGAGAGIINEHGKYTASSPGIYHIVATSAADASVSAVATVLVDEEMVAYIDITPSGVELARNEQFTFSAEVVGIEDQAVNWTASAGKILGNGQFTSPHLYGAVQIRAVSRADPSVDGIATVLVTEPGGQRFQYDPNGKLTFDGVRRYLWDAENRLERVIQPGDPANGRGERVWVFQYDGFGRMRRMIERLDGTTVENRTFLWVGDTLAEERTGNGAVVARRFFAEGMQEGGVNYYFFRDHLGSVRDMTDAAGEVRARYDYDAWGRRTVIPAIDTGDGGDDGRGDPPPVARDKTSPIGFNGFLHHDGLDLDFALYRVYSPSLGRWLSRDPIGMKGGMNLYAFAGNDPVNRVDPLGLDHCPPGWEHEPEDADEHEPGDPEETEAGEPEVADDPTEPASAPEAELPQPGEPLPPGWREYGSLNPDTTPLLLLMDQGEPGSLQRLLFMFTDAATQMKTQLGHPPPPSTPFGSLAGALSEFLYGFGRGLATAPGRVPSGRPPHHLEPVRHPVGKH